MKDHFVAEIETISSGRQGAHAGHGVSTDERAVVASGNDEQRHAAGQKREPKYRRQEFGDHVLKEYRRDDHTDKACSSKQVGSGRKNLPPRRAEYLNSGDSR